MAASGLAPGFLAEPATSTVVAVHDRAVRPSTALAALTGLVLAAVGLVAVPAQAADPGFRLPFENGRQFQITQGPAQHAAGAYPDYNRHAIDFATPVGTPVLASAGGTINFEGYDSTGAIQIRIDHGADRCTQYVHLSRSIVNTGQSVARGALIGYSGSTGLSSGPHLHFNMVYCSTQRSRAARARAGALLTSTW